MNAHSGAKGFLIAVGAVAVATGIRWLLAPLVGEELPALTYYLAVLWVAWVATLGPALTALFLGAAASFIFMPQGPATPYLVDLIRYLVVGSAAAVAMRSALVRAERNQARLSETMRQSLAAQSALTESERRFSTLIGQMRDYAIFFIDGSGRATSWNEGVKRVLGYDEEEFIGQDLTEKIFPPEDVRRGVPQRELATAAERGTANNDRWMLRKDGTRFYAMGVTVARRDDEGRLVGFAKIMRDQTDRQRLEDLLGDTARHLAEVNQRQSHFLAMLSHELRNPLAPIRIAAEILRIPGRSERESKEAIEMIYRQVGQLVRLVDDLLDMNRIRSGKVVLRRERFDLSIAVTHAIEAAKAYCLHNPITVDFPGEPVSVEGDAARLTQVVSNLLHNACKFTPNGGRVHVTLSKESSQAVVRVEDAGIGIEPENLERIFEMFEQAAGDRSEGGLGIGLTLSRSLVEMHQGKLEVRSEGSGKGSEFTVRLPLADTEHERVDAPAAPVQAEGVRRNVLVVDDNRDAMESLATVVRLNGHEVHCAHDGEEAVAQERKHNPDIVLLDIGLPKLDGYEVARRIRARRGSNGLKIVAITGWGQEEDVRRSREAGFDAHVTKPIDYPVLLDLLRGQTP